MLEPASSHVMPPSVEVSSTPPSEKKLNTRSKLKRCQKVSVALGALAGTKIALLVNRWSETSFTSGTKAEKVPVWAAVVTALQPHPPGSQIGALDVKPLSVSLSKPWFNGVVVQ